MIYDKHAMDYQLNLYTLHEFETIVPMTTIERSNLRKWVKNGHAIDSNPWAYRDSDNYELNYLQAFRIEYGYSSGPWDNWRGSEWQELWDEQLERFIRNKNR